MLIVIPKREILMRYILVLIFSVLLASCVTNPSYQYIQGGERVNQPGVTFMLPTKHKWAAILRSTYQSAFGALGMPKNDTVIVSSSVYNIKSPNSKEEFLALIKKGRASGAKTGRFEIIHNSEQLYEEHKETCVIYRSSSKDFGKEAKRGGEYSVLETLGIHCIHPNKPNIGIQVEFSRKAPPHTTYQNFDNYGKVLLKSVSFGEF